MKRWLFLFLFLISSACVSSQAKLRRDTAHILPRSFNNNSLESFKSNKDFQYNKFQEPPLSLWDKFWNWIWYKISQLLKTRNGRVTFWSLLIILGIAIIVFFVVKITGMGQGSLFARNSKGLMKYSLSQNDINHISFDEEIEKAINNKNYRLAIRLQYLQALKKLSDKGYINWRINKTNTDYLNETSGKSFNGMFKKLTLNFEYTWYGERQLSHENFLELSQQFQQFNTQL